MAVHTKPTSTDTFLNGQVSGQTVNPGDIILYESGVHTGTQYFSDFTGSSGNPIVIDLNGNDVDAQNNNNVLRLVNSSFITIRNGTLRNSSTNIILTTEAFNIRLENIVGDNAANGSGFRLGFSTKATDSSYWRENFTEDYVEVVDCTISNVRFEGIYVGNSDPQRWSFTSANIAYAQNYLLRAIVKGCTVYNTGYDGIQVGSTTGWAEVCDNEVYNYGTSSVDSHANGIQMGVATRGLCYNNLVHSGSHRNASFQILGAGVSIFNNISIDGGAGIYLFDRMTFPNRSARVFNNTFVSMSVLGIYYTATYHRHNKMYNNIFHMFSGSVPDTINTWYIRSGSADDNPIDDQNNIFTFGTAGLNSLDFVDLTNNDVRLGNSSTALNTGKNLINENSKLILNKSGSVRPFSGSWNIGAY